MALAMEKWNLHRRIALKIMMYVGVGPGKILFGFMFATATPPNAIVFGTHKIQIKTMVRTVLILNVISILVILGITRLLGV